MPEAEAGARRRSRRSGLESPSPPKRWAPWVLPLAAGLCFGVGYGLTDRLLSLGQGEAVKLDQSFDVKPFPGTSLESLRLRFGADKKELPGNPELIQQESSKKETSKQESSKPRQVQPASEAASERSDSTPEPQGVEPAGEPAPPAAPPPPPAPDVQP
ncbi:hypothetical protein [Synechococcus sp. 1G10]|uniref:hypothetical protein n=1 Tax=Synechococcus sp. 1G10 TaxID=2025605 RepID=UPI00117C5C08|nr:hypothetical protein [Synechococcus sp. 1G10]